MKRFLFSVICMLLAFAGFAQEQITIKHGPYLQNLKETETTIVWVANKASVGWVEVAPDDGTSYYRFERSRFFDSTNGVKNVSELHAVRITGLKPGTSYRYRIYSQEVLERKGEEIVYGNVAAPSIYDKRSLKFTTNDRNKPATSFIMLNDIHGNTDYIPKLLNNAGFKETDMIIYNGDMMNWLMDEEDLFKGFMDVTVDLFATHKPMYYARGNHETRGLFAASFQHYFSPKEPHLYFLLRQGPVCFIFLDTGEDKPDSDIEYHGITDYDNYRTEQAKWLSEIVKSPDFLDAKFKVVIAHMPPLPDQDLWHGQGEVLEKFVPILNDAQVDVMLSGHLHQYFNNKPTDKVHFPVIDNSSNTVLKGVIEGNQLNMEVKNMNGEVIDKISIMAK
ncbi:ser/Thr phosphatase family protein [Bacteroides intestinalis CAG:315]|uniref:Purple acid phosphatase n=1 Tax=Bacteroides intestinalis TaxID=329854 RepID=A0A412XV20_9BACE|nr:FN3 domain-containing metallophosphoesterase family protein [Bacteroides intestinalis]RGV49046.1 purple acid phosphatase [Bacteroides intestinalis]RHA54714.1 purple acid phosphatase [Bacteroides intestinalis]CDD96083.1 ser/Thr phosphatase family protein [Bacteroides intestinalis CAG:315]